MAYCSPGPFKIASILGHAHVIQGCQHFCLTFRFQIQPHSILLLITFVQQEVSDVLPHLGPTENNTAQVKNWKFSIPNNNMARNICHVLVIFNIWENLTDVLTSVASSEPLTGCTVAVVLLMTGNEKWTDGSRETPNMHISISNTLRNTGQRTYFLFFPSIFGTCDIHHSDPAAVYSFHSPCLWWSTDSCNTTGSWDQLSLGLCNIKPPEKTQPWSQR